MIAVLVIIPVLYLWTWGTMMAFSNEHYLPSYGCQDYRERLGVEGVFSLFPPVWVLSPFLTGFYQYGWSLSKPKECREAVKGRL